MAFKKLTNVGCDISQHLEVKNASILDSVKYSILIEINKQGD